MAAPDLVYTTIPRLSSEKSEEGYAIEISPGLVHAVRVDFVTPFLANIVIEYRRKEPIKVESVLVFKETDGRSLCEVTFEKETEFVRGQRMVIPCDSSKLVE